MVNTIKFSQMTNAGNINNNDIMPSLRGGLNVTLNNPWTFLPSGTTAQRPIPSSTVNYRLRFNTDDQLYEYYDAVLGAWTQLQENTFTVGPFITYTAAANLPDAQNLGALANGILKQTITSGSATLNIAVNGTDYYGPGFVVRPADGGTGVNNGALTITLGSATLGYVLTSDSSGNATWQPVSASGSITTIDGDSGSVTPTAGVVTITGSSTGLTFTGSSSTLILGGLLNPTFGGLGVSNPTAHGVLVGEGASAVNPIVLGAGQILIGTTSGDPAAAAINSGTNILVGNSSGSITISITGVISPTNGGTGVNNGSNTLTLGGNLTTSGAFNSTFTMTNTTNVTFPTSGTLATTSQLPTPSALTSVNDTNVTMTLGGSPTVALLAATSLTLGWTGTLAETRGGTNQSTYTLGDTLYSSGANTLAKLAGNTTTAKQYLSQTGTGSVSAAPVWATISGSDITGAALTSVNDTNVTMTLGGTPTTALLRAASLTLGWTGTLSGTRGGTGVNNGANTATFAGNLNFAAAFTTSGAFAVTQTYTGITNVTFPTSGTLATTSQIPTGAALTKTDDTNVTLTLGGSPTTALVNAASLTLGWTGQLGLTRGGTAASLTASNGGIVYSTASALAILSGTATAQQLLLSGASGAPSWSTTTYPTTNAINTLLYASSANVMSALATANNGVLVTSAGGVPSISTTLPSGLTIPSPIITTALFDTNVNKVIGLSSVASAVNYFNVSNSATNSAVGITAAGSDTNVLLSISGQGTSGVQIQGNSAGTNPSTGFVRETISSVIAAASATSLVTATAKNVTSISLTAGDWDVWGNIFFTIGGVCTNTAGWISSTSATVPDASLYNGVANVGVLTGGFSVPSLRFNVSSTTTVYLTAFAQFTTSTVTACGGIYARRR